MISYLTSLPSTVSQSPPDPSSFMVVYESEFEEYNLIARPILLRGMVDSSSFVVNVSRRSSSSMMIRVDNLRIPEFWLEISLNPLTLRASAKGRLAFCVKEFPTDFLPIKNKRVLYSPSNGKYYCNLSIDDFCSPWFNISEEGKKDILLFDAALYYGKVQYNRLGVIDMVKVKNVSDEFIYVEVSHSECPHDFYLKLQVEIK